MAKHILKFRFFFAASFITILFSSCTHSSFLHRRYESGVYIEHSASQQLAVVAIHQKQMLDTRINLIHAESITPEICGKKAIRQDYKQSGNGLLASEPLISRMTNRALQKIKEVVFVNLRPSSSLKKPLKTVEDHSTVSTFRWLTKVTTYFALGCLSLAMLTFAIAWIIGINYSMSFVIISLALLGIAIVAGVLALIFGLIWLIAKQVLKKNVEKGKQGGA